MGQTDRQRDGLIAACRSAYGRGIIMRIQLANILGRQHMTGLMLKCPRRSSVLIPYNADMYRMHRRRSRSTAPPSPAAAAAATTWTHWSYDAELTSLLWTTCQHHCLTQARHPSRRWVNPWVESGRVGSGPILT